MVVHCDIVVAGATVVFDCDAPYVGAEPQELRETLEAHMDLASIDDDDVIGTASFPTSDDNGGHTSFSIKDEYKEHSILF